jgi:hypothetical protein
VRVSIATGEDRARVRIITDLDRVRVIITGYDWARVIITG